MSDSIRFIPDLRNRIVSLVSALSDQQNWALSAMGAELAWQYCRGNNVKVAVLDTGWFAHKDLQANLAEGHDATGNNDYFDHGNGHGTHVAGIIAANCGDNAGVKGVAPEAKLVPIKTLNDDGCGSYDYIVKALEIANDLDVDIVNMSLGSAIAPDNDRMHILLKNLMDKGKIVVCAAGNDGGSVNYPARYDEVIAVAAVEQSGNLAKFSSRGKEIDTGAPGVRIYSTWLDNQYIILDGTSMACPSIAGVVALIVGWYKNNPDPGFTINTPSMIKLLVELGGETGEGILAAGGYNIGVPKFANFTDWKPESL